MRSLDTIRDVRLLSGRRKISRAAVFRLPRDKSAQQSQAKTLTIVAQSPSLSSCGEQSRPTTSQPETGSTQLEQEQQYGGSQATLRPSSHSVSELSCISGEPEMEFDLYDCDIDNVMRAPGSMFAPAYWECEDEAATPTLDLEMVQLFPREEEEAVEVDVGCRTNRRKQVRVPQ